MSADHSTRAPASPWQSSRVRVRHGKSKTRAYRIWIGIKSRCYNPDKREYSDYGGRGIRLCDDWQNFKAFYSFVVSLLPPGQTDIPAALTVERRNTNGNYEPGNVRLATRKEQNRNTRRNRLITIGGITRSMAEWAELNGIGYQRANTRIYKGWDEVAAVTVPPRLGNRRPK